MHPGDEGVVRWTLYRCGHMHTRLVIDDDVETTAAPSAPEPLAL